MRTDPDPTPALWPSTGDRTYNGKEGRKGRREGEAEGRGEGRGGTKERRGDGHREGGEGGERGEGGAGGEREAGKGDEGASLKRSDRISAPACVALCSVGPRTASCFFFCVREWSV